MTVTSTKPERAHLSLGEAFYDVVSPAHFPKAVLRFRNDRAARLIGLEGLTDEDWVSHFARFEPFEGSLPSPLALRYHGHQFGHYNPDLGDGRGFLFAQFSESGTGRLIDLGTKGSGQTPYSRTADGRLTLKGAVREILATELLDARGVATSHTLSVIETGEQLVRHDEPSPTRAAVLVRQLHSHIRIGSFQRLAYHKQQDEMERLLRYSISHYYPALNADDTYERLITAFIEALSLKMAKMVAGWMAAGFVHGVLNTDNFNITGESFDYGPWRFLPTFQPGFTAAYFDQTSRYAYGRQPQAAMWALCRLADCFVGIVSTEALQDALARFYPELEMFVARHIIWRLGCQADDEQAADITQALFTAASDSQIGWDRLFADLYGGRIEPGDADPLWSAHKGLKDVAEICAGLKLRQSQADIGQVRACGLVSLEHQIMESLWAPIAEADDWTPLNHEIARIRRYGDAMKAGS